MSKRTLGIALIVVGVVVVAVALGADALGIGNQAGIGLKQGLLAVVGVVIAAAGVWMGRGEKR